MPEIIRPTWEHLREVVSTANERLIVCSPFYYAKGIGRVFDDLNETASLEFWTRLSPSDWATRVVDPDELLALLDILDSNGVEVRLRIFQQLHAKVYAADHRLALVGSANLSEGGFGNNLELTVRFRGAEAVQAITSVEEACTPVLRTVTLEQLRRWVEFSRSAIEEARSTTVENLEVLAPAQSELDLLLNFGGVDSSTIAEPTVSDMEQFVEWLESNAALPGADILYRRHHNLDNHNLQGHFKQSFFAAVRFLSEHAELRELLVLLR